MAGAVRRPGCSADSGRLQMLGFHPQHVPLIACPCRLSMHPGPRSHLHRRQARHSGPQRAEQAVLPQLRH